MPGPPPNHLPGRDVELRRLDDFLDSAGRSGAALLVSGEAGIGKTALLDALADVARSEGWLVLAAGGVEFETAVGFSALNQLLTPLLGELDRMPSPHDATLSVALGLRDGRAVQRADLSRELVEAAVRTGRTTEAARHVVAMTEAGIASVSSRLALAVAGAAAIAAPEQEAVASFDRALAVPGSTSGPSTWPSSGWRTGSTSAGPGRRCGAGWSSPRQRSRSSGWARGRGRTGRGPSSLSPG